MFDRIKTLLRDKQIEETKSSLELASADSQKDIPHVDDSAGIQTIVARQPIFDTKGQVWGYELLYRRPEQELMADVVDGDVATSSVIVNGYDVVKSGLRAGQKVLINFTGDLIEAQVIKLLPSQACIAEILEDTQPTPQILAAVKQLKSAGYSIAVDDYIGQDNLLPFLPFADILKVDLPLLSEQDLVRQINILKKYPARLLAEKVEDWQTAAECRSLGFTLFQGYFFSRPELVQGRKIAPSQAMRMRIMALCAQENTPMAELTEAIRFDPIIMVRFLRFVNSAYFSFSVKVNSIEHALNLVGRMTFMQWLCVTALADMNSKPLSKELAYLAAQRAKFMETLALTLQKRHALPPDVSVHSIFLIGLFSLLESSLGIPLQELFEGIPLNPEVLAALRNENSPYRIWVGLMIFYERGEWDKAFLLGKKIGLAEEEISKSYADAVAWSSTFFATGK